MNPSWINRLLRSALLSVTGVISAFNVVFLISGMEMGFPNSTMVGIWLYTEVAMSIALTLTGIGILFTGVYAVRSGVYISALSVIVLLFALANIALRSFGAGIYTAKLADIAILITLPLALSLCSLILNLRSLKRFQLAL
jgi:hypothetical protein